MEKEKKLTPVVCFLLPLKGEIKICLMLAAYFLRLETPGLPACYPLTTSIRSAGVGGERQASVETSTLPSRPTAS